MYYKTTKINGQLWANVDGFTPLAENDLPDSTVDGIVIHTEYERNGREYFKEHTLYLHRN